MTNEPQTTTPHPDATPYTLDGPDAGRASELGPVPRWSEREWPMPWMGAFLDALALMPNATAACRAAGVARSWAYEVAQTHPDFAEAWEQARLEGAELLERHVHSWGTVGITVTETRTTTKANGEVEKVEIERIDVNPQIAMMLLKRWKTEYRDTSRVEHSGRGGSPIEMEVNRLPTRERMLELAQLARDLELPAAVRPVIEVGGSRGDEAA